VRRRSTSIPPPGRPASCSTPCRLQRTRGSLRIRRAHKEARSAHQLPRCA
jgi:hypothetical protein